MAGVLGSGRKGRKSLMHVRAGALRILAAVAAAGLPMLVVSGFQAAGAPTGRAGGKRDSDPCDLRLSELDSRPVPDVNSKIWWPKSSPQDEKQAKRLASALAGRIWPKLSKLMGLEQPLPDRDFSCSGDDNSLDVYLDSAVKPKEGITPTLGPDC